MRRGCSSWCARRRDDAARRSGCGPQPAGWPATGMDRSMGLATRERLERSLRLSLFGAGGEELLAPQSLTRGKDFRLDDDNLLASEAERQNVLRELERALFELLVERLARI